MPSAIVNRSSSSTGLLVTFVPTAMDGSTHGSNQPISPITGVGTSIFLRWNMSHTHGIITHNRLTMLISLTKTRNLYRAPRWTKLTPSSPMLAWHRYQVRSTNWLQSFGTFLTMTGNPMLRSSRSLRIREMT